MKIKLPKNGYQKLTEAKARLIAHLIGDGCLVKSNHDYNLKYEVKDLESLNQFRKDLIEVYGLKPTEGTNRSGKTGEQIPFIRLRSKIVFEDFRKYATYYSKDWNINPPLFYSSIEIKREFLKALFDDEGSVIFSNKKPFIRLYSINRKGLDQIALLLSEFGLFGKMVPGFGARRNVYALTIMDSKRFKEKIGFNLSRKQNLL